MPRTSKRTTTKRATASSSKEGPSETRKKLRSFKEGNEDPEELKHERKEILDEIEKDEEKAEEEYEKEHKIEKEEESDQTKGKSKASSEAPKVKSSHHKKEEGEKKQSKLLETGRIYFMYKPKVGESEAHSIKDVQRLFVLLAPENNSERKSCLISIPKKQLPSTTRHARNFGIVIGVSDDSDPHKLAQEALSKEQYETETKGDRTQYGARIAGEGVYSIVDYHNNSHLAYALEVPKEEDIGDVQRAFHIEKEGSFVLSVKNPKSSTSTTSDSSEFPKELLDQFGTRRWATCNPTTFLNVKNAELLLIGAAHNIVEELGKPAEDLEQEHDEDIEELEKHHGTLESHVLEELGVRRSNAAIQPLKGDWK